MKKNKKIYSNKNTIITAIVFSILLHLSLFMFKNKEDKKTINNSHQTTISVINIEEQEELRNLILNNSPEKIIKPNLNDGYSSLNKKNRYTKTNNIFSDHFEIKEYKYSPKLKFNVENKEIFKLSKQPAFIKTKKYPNFKSSKKINISTDIIDDEIKKLLNNDNITNATVLEIIQSKHLPRIKIKQSSGNLELDNLLIKKILNRSHNWKNNNPIDPTTIWFNWSKKARRIK